MDAEKEAEKEAEREARRRRRGSSGSSGSGRALTGREQQQRWAQASMAQAHGSTTQAHGGGDVLATSSRLAAGLSLHEATEEPTPFPHAAGASVSVAALPYAPWPPPSKREERREERTAREEQLSRERQESFQERHAGLLAMLRNIPYLELALPATTCTGHGSDAHTAFVVQLAVRRDVDFARARHTVARRYSDFERLHEALAKAWGKQASRARGATGRRAEVGA